MRGTAAERERAERETANATFICTLADKIRIVILAVREMSPGSSRGLISGSSDCNGIRKTGMCV